MQYIFWIKAGGGGGNSICFRLGRGKYYSHGTFTQVLHQLPLKSVDLSTNQWISPYVQRSVNVQVCIHMFRMPIHVEAEVVLSQPYFIAFKENNVPHALGPEIGIQQVVCLKTQQTVWDYAPLHLKKWWRGFTSNICLISRCVSEVKPLQEK